MLAATAATGLVGSYVGDETLSERAVLILKCLVEHRLVTNGYFFTACAEREIVRGVWHFFPEPHDACCFQSNGLWKNLTHSFFFSREVAFGS